MEEDKLFIFSGSFNGSLLYAQIESAFPEWLKVVHGIETSSAWIHQDKNGPMEVHVPLDITPEQEIRLRNLVLSHNSQELTREEKIRQKVIESISTIPGTRFSDLTTTQFKIIFGLLLWRFGFAEVSDTGNLVITPKLLDLL